MSGSFLKLLPFAKNVPARRENVPYNSPLLFETFTTLSNFDVFQMYFLVCKYENNNFKNVYLHHLL